MSETGRQKGNSKIGWVLLGLSVIGVFLYAAPEGFLIAWRPIIVRAATADDKIAPRYFGFDVETVDSVRNIAVVEGTFSKDTWLSAVQYVVRSGNSQTVTGFTVGRSPNRIGEARWINMQIKLALADTKRPGGQATQLGSAGHTRGEGVIGELVQDFSVGEKQTFPGRLRAGRKYILHVEGDRPFGANREMPVEEFAEKNAGNFYVVIVELN